MQYSVLLSLTAHLILCLTTHSVYVVNVNILVCLCFLQIAIVKSQVGQETFQKIVQRKSWSLGEESSTDGKASKEKERLRNLEVENKQSLDGRLYFS